LYPEYKHKVEIITNPIDTEVIKKMAKIDEISYPNNVFNFIAVGSLKHVKGYDILLNAHEELIREGIVHHLYIIGTGHEKEKIENMIIKGKMEESVSLLGYKENPYRYMSGADGFVMSSRYEGYSLVVAEALVLGLPIKIGRAHV